MPITLVCLVKGNLPANAFPVDINGNKLIGHLKGVIKAKKAPCFDDIPADELKLWKVEIPDDQDSELANLELADELLATRDVEDYWTSKPPKRHIHVLVKPPETATSSREQELLEKVALLRAHFNKSVHEFNVIVSPKWVRSFKWTVNIEHATLEALKDSIRA
ncbi:1747_t:CDS:2, partial [Paraglomus brasilianum]